MALHTGVSIRAFQLNDENYVELITAKYGEWIQEFADVQDKRLLWDLIKYKIRQFTISYSKGKAKERRNKFQDVENRLKENEKLCAENPTEENIEALEELTESNIILCMTTSPKAILYVRGRIGMRKGKK